MNILQMIIGWYSRIYNKTLSTTEVLNLYAAFVDNTAPTANIIYTPNSWTCYSGNVTATLTGYSENIIITNNGWSNSFIFTDNGSYTFQFKDYANNTWTATALVSWICKDPVSIGWPAMISWAITVSNEFQIVEQVFPDYFRVEDPIGGDNGYYTTIAITDFSWTYGHIDSSSISLKANSLNTIQWTSNPRVALNTNLTNYQSIGNPITYIKREPNTNFNITGKYWNKPRLRINIPAYTRIDDYRATLNYTLYEN